MRGIIQTKEETIEDIRGLLSSGWLSIHGDTDFIQKLEEAVYTPGTNENANFILTMAHIMEDSRPKLLSLFFGKKTKRLVEYLSEHSSNMEGFKEPMEKIINNSLEISVTSAVKEGKWIMAFYKYSNEEDKRNKIGGIIMGLKKILR